MRQDEPQTCDGCGVVDGCRCMVTGGYLTSFKIPSTPMGPLADRCRCPHPRVSHPRSGACIYCDCGEFSLRFPNFIDAKEDESG